MGCCFSAGNHHPDTEHRRSTDGAPPTSPPGAIEEETVKEVLLETPVFVSKSDEKIKAMPPGNRQEDQTTTFHCKSNPPGQDNGDIVAEISEASEMCSYSESFSNATATEKKDDDEDGVVNQRPPPRKRRAAAGGRGRGERVVARRMAAPSPERRGQVVPLRPVRGRPVAGQPRNAAEENGRRRDAGEGSGRRSESPAKRANEVSERRNVNDVKIPGKGGGRNDVATEEARSDVATEEARSDVAPEEARSDVATEEAESLENPVVSLECFIFL